MTKYCVPEKPCPTCPYRRDTPPGVWAPEEYVKLLDYDQPTADQPIAVFLCHDGDRGHDLCRGWVEVHGKQTGETALISERIAVMSGLLSPGALDVEPCGVAMYDTGTEACHAGLSGVDNPSQLAQRAADKLLRTHPDLKTRDDE